MLNRVPYALLGAGSATDSTTSAVDITCGRFSRTPLFSRYEEGQMEAGSQRDRPEAIQRRAGAANHWTRRGQAGDLGAMGSVHGLDRGDGWRFLAGRASDAAATLGGPDPQALPRGRVQLRARGPYGRPARRRRGLRRGRATWCSSRATSGTPSGTPATSPVGSWRSSRPAVSSTSLTSWGDGGGPGFDPAQLGELGARYGLDSSPTASRGCARSTGSSTRCFLWASPSARSLRFGRPISRRGSSLLNDCGHGCGLRDIDRMAGRNLLNC